MVYNNENTCPNTAQKELRHSGFLARDFAVFGYESL